MAHAVSDLPRNDARRRFVNPASPLDHVIVLAPHNSARRNISTAAGPDEPLVFRGYGAIFFAWRTARREKAIAAG